MRIIGGTHRGRKLAAFEGEDIRPTSDRVKESLFNILSDSVRGAAVLDLFCGSGNLGLESLSRGAAAVHFNDISKDSLALLRKNVAAMGVVGACTVTNYDYLTCLGTAKKKYDIIFLDPPYRFDYGVHALKAICDYGLLNPDGVVIYERDRAFSGDGFNLEKYDERKYGKTYITFFRTPQS